MRAFYFGCVDTSGHYLHSNHGREYGFGELPSSDHPNVVPKDDLAGFPWGWWIDGDLQPQGDQTEGRCVVHHVASEWTALAFWDRSVDKRPGSCSVFIAEGHHLFAGMVMLFKATFPRVIQRFRFPLTEHYVCECPEGRHRPIRRSLVVAHRATMKAMASPAGQQLQAIVREVTTDAVLERAAALPSTQEDSMAKRNTTKTQPMKVTPEKKPYTPPTVTTEPGPEQLPPLDTPVGPLVSDGDGDAPLPLTGICQPMPGLFPPPADVTPTVPTSVGLLEKIAESEKRAKTVVKCEPCGGTGRRPEGTVLPHCPECNGGGTVLR